MPARIAYGNPTPGAHCDYWVSDTARLYCDTNASSFDSFWTEQAVMRACLPEKETSFVGTDTNLVTMIPFGPFLNKPVSKLRFISP